MLPHALSHGCGCMQRAFAAIIDVSSGVECCVRALLRTRCVAEGGLQQGGAFEQLETREIVCISRMQA